LPAEEMKEIMQILGFSTRLQHVFTCFSLFLGDFRLFSSFFVLASKFLLLLPSLNAGYRGGVLSLRAAYPQNTAIALTNQIQRENDSNGGIATFDHKLSALQNKLFKQCLSQFQNSADFVIKSCSTTTAIFAEFFTLNFLLSTFYSHNWCRNFTPLAGCAKLDKKPKG
jgi:hypothetical protein